METTRFSIVKLGNGNYSLWKFKVEMLLSKDGLWELVDEPPPTQMDADWKTRNRQAMAIVSLSVEDGQLTHIRDCKTAREMWITLKKLHESPNINSKLYILRKLFRARLDNEGDLAAHIDYILNLTAQLRDLGEDLRDNLIAAIILCSLPNSYGPLISALEARPDSELTTEFVKIRLMDEHRRRVENKAMDVKTPERVYRTTRGYKYEHKQRKETRECYNCGKVGHLKRDCRTNSRFANPEYKPKKINYANNVKNATIRENIDDSREYGDLQCFVTPGIGNQHNVWCIDSGATNHMTGNHKFFDRLDTLETQETVRMADGRYLEAVGIGSGILVSRLNYNVKPITINKVFYVPGLDCSLLSVKRLTQLGYKIIFEETKCEIIKNNKLIAKAELKGNLYGLYSTNSALKVDNPQRKCLHLWHRRFGHRDRTAIQNMMKNRLVCDMEIDKCDIISNCTECIEGKMTVKSFPKQSHSKATKPYQILHSDVCGPMKTPTPSGNRYLATITDDYSRYTELFLLKTKDEICQKIIEYFQKWNNYFGRKPLKLRTDGGGEFINDELSNYLKGQGIQRQVTTPYSPQQNGVAERRNRSIIEMTRCMLLDAKMDNKYWGEATTTAVYLQNRLPTKGCERTTPYEAWYNKKPNINHLRVFGSKAYIRIPNAKLDKLDCRTETGIMVGYSNESKAYRILLPKTDRIRISRSATFDEDNYRCDKTNASKSTEHPIVNTHEEVGTEIIFIPPEDKQSTSGACDPIYPETLTPRISQRINKGIPAEKWTYLSETIPITEPENWNQLSKLPVHIRNKWMNAVSDEMESFKRNKVWDLVELPAHKTTIGTRWTFRYKTDSEGKIVKLKARLVAQGYSQIEGQDFNETYAPVVKYTTVRALLKIAATKGMNIRHLDVKTAFLYGDLQEEIYVSQPEGLVEEGNENKVYKLNKAMYGLRQAAYEWNSKINGILLEYGYKRGKGDACLYTKNINGIYSYILIYVDDLLICSDDAIEIEQLSEKLFKEFEMKDLGNVNYYLGINISRSKDGGYVLTQTAKINQLINELQLENSNTSNIPMRNDFQGQRLIDSKPLTNGHRYRQAVGALLHIASVSRPDISVAVNILGRYVSEPNNKDWEAVKLVTKYLKGTPNLGVIIEPTDDLQVSGYVDSDWGGDTNDRKSTSGYIFFLGNSPISWNSRKQTCVTLSSTEAEYVAGTLACQELLWIRTLMNDFGLKHESATVVYEDNQGCIKLAEGCGQHARSKHIDIKYHFLRDLCHKNIVKLTYCPTKVMVADLLTKPVEVSKFVSLRDKLGLGTLIC